MPNPSEEGLRESEEGLEAIYRLAYTYAREALRDGTHPDAVRLALLLADDSGLSTPPRVVEAKWRGLEDALAGRPRSPRAVVGPRGRRRWRVDQRPGLG